MDYKLPSSFNFSLPPPGFPRPPVQSYDTRPPPPSQGNGDVKYTPVKSELNSPLPAGTSGGARYAYYQGSSVQTDYSRSTGQTHLGMSYAGVSGSSAMSLSSGSFSMPPPPPPMGDPYPKVSPSPIGYAMPGGMYSYGMPPTPPPPTIGAGQYVTKKHGNYHQHHTQGDYNRGYDKRSGYYSHLNRKRNMSHENDYDGTRKPAKKKKKPLSQNLPSRKEWTTEEAQRALAVEREYNKLHKSPSLIIKFPDLELNRDIVSAFNPLIESVHFQQPSTPRFCFVTLSDASRINEVIESLNKTKFGLGYLSAEPKNTKDEDSVKGPEDIDPLTLYVGNLAQEVTVDDVVKAYPKHKRIDIGFAKKMKYTRYAFVGFRTVDDAIEAFQSTHSTEMYNKSLIVRFRRLHGTVGLPGDPKTQAGRKQRTDLEHSENSPSDEAIMSSYLARDMYEEAEVGLPDMSEDAKNVVIKEEYSEENETNSDGPVSGRSPPHVPMAQPKTELEDFPIQTEIKQEKPDADESGSDFDFMRDFVGEDEEDP